MACKDFEELILRDLDNEIAAADRSRLQEHFGSCAACKADRDAFARVDEAIRRCSSPAVPRQDFASDAIHRAETAQVLAPRRVHRRVSSSVWTLLGIAGVLLILGSIGVLVWFGFKPGGASPQDVAVLPRIPIPTRVPKADPTENRTIEITIPEHREATWEELRRIYPFAQVNPVEEMTHLIKAHRLYELNMKSLKTYDELMNKEANNIGKN